MNIFKLANSPVEAARLNQDIHVKKICLEVAQMLANCYTLEQLKTAPKTKEGNTRKYSHFNHPVSIWVRQNINNFNWTLLHGLTLCEEFEYRFGKKHFVEGFIKWCDENYPNLNDAPETEQPQCFVNRYPQLVVPGNPVLGYQKYYQADKKTFTYNLKNGKTKIVNASWTKRETPEFMR